MLHNANNFKQQVLNRYGINHVKIRTKPWFLVTIDNAFIKNKLSAYSPQPLTAKVGDYTHYICIGQQIDEPALLAKLTPLLAVNGTQGCPTWWRAARKWLDANDYKYTVDPQKKLIDGAVYIQVHITQGDTSKLPLCIEKDNFLFRVPRYVSTDYRTTGSLKTYIISSLLYYAFHQDEENFEKALLSYIKHFVLTATVVTNERVKTLMSALTIKPAEVGVSNWRGPEETILVNISDMT